MVSGRRRMGKKALFFCLLVWLAAGIVGCSMAQGKTGDNRKVDYTVVKKEDLPAEVKKVIDSKKQERFQMTYQGEGELYIMKGYGIQSSGGYSIQVEYVTENEEEVHVKTKLVGPASREEQKDTISSPYLVVKMEDRDKKVIFD